MATSGAWESSNDLLNQLYHNIVWGQKGNFLDVPTDCPQRDERLGWTGDAQVFAPTAAFNMDVAGFFAKWLADVALDQAQERILQFRRSCTINPAGHGDDLTTLHLFRFDFHLFSPKESAEPELH
jgi:hypothetical protein